MICLMKKRSLCPLKFVSIIFVHSKRLLVNKWIDPLPISWAKKLLAGLQDKQRHLVSFLALGRFNFTLAFKVVGGKPACDMVCNQLRFIAIRDGLTGCNGRQLTISVEQSAERRRALSLFCAAKDAARSVLGTEDTTWEAESRGMLALFSKISKISPDNELFGEYDKVKREWVWKPEPCLRLGFPLLSTAFLCDYPDGPSRRFLNSQCFLSILGNVAVRGSLI